ncbi:MAG: DUF86 domain-containing protein [Candidatus Aenigmatarchaeota archaeon]|nr:MAG: DUF86 domain-containing protein [Candidatus Aenigmarchaeota archaeon]
MKREIYDYVKDILDNINYVMEFTKGIEFEDFANDKKTVYAVIRSLEIIGEASKKIPKDIKEKYKEIPWKQMSGMRDKLIHEYHGVDIEIVWTVVKKELPPLKPSIEKMLKDIE